MQHVSMAEGGGKETGHFLFFFGSKIVLISANYCSLSEQATAPLIRLETAELGNKRPLEK